MSQDNVEVVRAAIEAMNREDAEALVAMLHPEIEWHMAIQQLLVGETGVYHGHHGIGEYFRDMDEAFEEVQVDCPDIRDLGDRVVALGSFRARGRGSGAEIESPVGAVVDMRAGRATRVLTYLDPTEALEAVGLSE
jgi:uncharacterized protein